MNDRVIESFVECLDRLASSGSMSQRRESIVGQYETWFFKVPLGPDGKVLGGDGLPNARYVNELRAMRVLAELSGQVPRIVATIESRGCIVYERLEGADLDVYLLQHLGTDERRKMINCMVEVLAGIHNRSVLLPVDVRSTFRRMQYLNSMSGQAILGIAGLDVRNFVLCGDGVWLIDPHELYIGCREQDIARLTITLLMMDWGRALLPRAWKSIRLDEVVAPYEQCAGAVLDRRMVRAFLQDELILRRSSAEKSVMANRKIPDMVGIRYVNMFFATLGNWIARNV